MESTTRYNRPLKSSANHTIVTPEMHSPNLSCDAELGATSTEARIKIPNGVNYDVMASGRRHISIANIPATEIYFPEAVYMPTLSSKMLTGYTPGSGSPDQSTLGGVIGDGFMNPEH